MARPRKNPADVRKNIFTIRLNDREFDLVKRAALDAGLPYGEYARETLLGRKPKALPKRDKVFHALFYELQSIATNFGQLEDATGDENFGKWKQYVGEDLAGKVLDRDELVPLIEDNLERINGVGQMVNSLARKANVGSELKKEDIDETLNTLQKVLEPLHEAARGTDRSGDFDGPDRG
jgi:Mobilization protein NikA